MWPSQRLASIGLDSQQRKSRARSRDRRGIKPTIMLLEDRQMLSTFNLTVTTLADPIGPDGTVSLRQAINTANADAVDSQVNINFTAGLHGTIDLTTALPSIYNPSHAGISISGPGPESLTVQRNANASNFSIFTTTGSVSISGMTITGGNAGSGGGIENTGGYSGGLTVTNDVFSNNTATGNGGAIHGATSLLVTSCTFSNNSAFQGGAIADFGWFIGVSGSTFTNNSASYGGAVLSGVNDSLYISSSTFVGNSASAQGGAIRASYRLITTDCTIYGNTAPIGGGIFNPNNDPVNGYLLMGNTIVAGNIGDDIDGPVTQSTSAYFAKNNLIGNGTGITNLPLDSSNLVGTASNPINPMLGPLQNNGGPTKTMALLPGSPAINAGNNAEAIDWSSSAQVVMTTDQRGPGYSRITGGTVDIGAYEFTPLSHTINFGTIKGQTYGVAPITLIATDTSGLPVSFSVISGPATLSGSVLTVTGMGNVVVEASQAGNATYAAATPVDESFTVSPALLTITANNDSKTYGTQKTFSSTAFTETGLVNGDTITNVTETSTGAATSATVGTYPIVPSAATGNRLSNYTITYINGMLTVNPASLLSLTVTTLADDPSAPISGSTTLRDAITQANAGPTRSVEITFSVTGTIRSEPGFTGPD